MITFSTANIAKVILNLDPKKAHGHNEISIRMLKHCSTSIYQSMGTFPNDWRMLFLFTENMTEKFPKLQSNLATSCAW